MYKRIHKEGRDAAATQLLGKLHTALRPCFGGGECNTELTAHGIGINMYADWYILSPFSSVSFKVGELISLPSTATVK